MTVRVRVSVRIAVGGASIFNRGQFSILLSMSRLPQTVVDSFNSRRPMSCRGQRGEKMGIAVQIIKVDKIS